MQAIASSDIISLLKRKELYVESVGEQQLINCVSSLDFQKRDSLSWSREINNIDCSKLKCRILLISDQCEISAVKNLLVIKTLDPRAAFVYILECFFKPQRIAKVHPSVNFGDNVSIGKNACIDANVVIGNDCKIGDNVTIYPNATIYNNTTIGNNVVIHANAVISVDGYGYIKNNNQESIFMEHLGGVVVEDDVVIGACTTISKGAIDDTVIGKGTKIDNLCHIAHNVVIGKNCSITAQSEISGSVIIGDNVWLAPAASVIDGIEIGRDSIIGLGAVVRKNIPEHSVVYGNPMFVRKR
ncbi:MAG: UDP-3-O-(3-hydroxymyristoyl)glucosamine N-acyltransferase [Colwellia sp.]